MEVVNNSKAVAISRSHAMNNPLGLIEGIDFSCFPVKDNLVIYSTTILFRKFHHLLPMIDEKIRGILESGLLMKWELDSNIMRKEAGGVSSSHEGEPQIKLALEHVEGAFLAIIAGLLVCLIVFILECVVRYMIKAKKFENFMSKIEKVLCYA